VAVAVGGLLLLYFGFVIWAHSRPMED